MNALARRLALLAVTALAAVWLISPQGVPLYDGVGVPDEPYRYVEAPVGYPATPEASPAIVQILPEGNWQDTSLTAASAEQAPQVRMMVRTRSLQADANAGPIKVTATPVAPAGHPPGRVIDGNVYRLTAEAGDAGPIPMTGDDLGAIAIRAATTHQPTAAVVYRPAADAPWEVLETGQVGQHTFTADLQGLGDYAVADATTLGSASTGSGTGIAQAPIIVGLLVLVLVGVLLCVRLLRRAPRAAAASTTTAGTPPAGTPPAGTPPAGTPPAGSA